jgi:hypothetical protein
MLINQNINHIETLPYQYHLPIDLRVRILVPASWEGSCGLRKKAAVRERATTLRPQWPSDISEIEHQYSPQPRLVTFAIGLSGQKKQSYLSLLITNFSLLIIPPHRLAGTNFSTRIVGGI